MQANPRIIGITAELNHALFHHDYKRKEVSFASTTSENDEKINFANDLERMLTSDNTANIP